MYGKTQSGTIQIRLLKVLLKVNLNFYIAPIGCFFLPTSGAKGMEPVSTSGLTAILKFYGAAIMVTLAVALVAAVVLMTRMPRSPQEWAVGLICTVVSSLAGGSFIIVKWGLHEWVTDVWGMIALGGFFFVCGLPGWALVRWIFNFIDKQEGKTIVEVIKEFKKARKDIENS
jgi:hypothetical protein